MNDISKNILLTKNVNFDGNWKICVLINDLFVLILIYWRCEI